jgi:hypothetical protein
MLVKRKLHAFVTNYIKTLVDSLHFGDCSTVKFFTIEIDVDDLSISCTEGLVAFDDVLWRNQVPYLWAVYIASDTDDACFRAMITDKLLSEVSHLLE